MTCAKPDHSAPPIYSTNPMNKKSDPASTTEVGSTLTCPSPACGRASVPNWPISASACPSPAGGRGVGERGESA
ncbi:hypothetical protein [Plasmodium yoelii yoelii]|uniref:Uncharacterized protein n=1 Tax=Plasmodium yoelii yoelii TaxID=73239 RepID=Q7R721_PLAYO|nr:hypothetical protein [Plasmodium yoelii yoelii]